MAKMYYTAEEVTAKLGITAADLEAYVRDQRLRVFKDGERDMYMVSEVDSLTPVTAANVPDIELAPAPDGIDLSAAETIRPATKEDTVITAEGISIFDDEDLEIESADPMAKTRIAPSIDDQIALDGVGSGSGLLDLTRESDDTSLGEVIDHIDLEEPVAGVPVTAAAAAAPYGEIAVPVAAEPEPMMDASAGLFSGLLVASAILGLLLGAVALATALNLQPKFINKLDDRIDILFFGSIAGIIVFGVVGMLIGKAIGARQKTVEKMSG